MVTDYSITQQVFDTIPPENICVVTTTGLYDILTRTLDEICIDYKYDKDNPSLEPTNSQLISWQLAEQSGNSSDVIVLFNGKMVNVNRSDWDFSDEN